MAYNGLHPFSRDIFLAVLRGFPWAGVLACAVCGSCLFVIVVVCSAIVHIILCCGVKCSRTFCVAVCRAIVHHFVLWCAVVRRVAMYSCTSFCVAVCSAVVHCVAVYGGVIHHFELQRDGVN